MGVLMKCGHTAQGKDRNGNPVCVICAGINPKAMIVEDELPNLEGRYAVCSYNRRRDGRPCTSKVPSSFDLPFFEYRPDKKTDIYYCGCWGWD